jgi:hypothetical protein
VHIQTYKVTQGHVCHIWTLSIVFFYLKQFFLRLDSVYTFRRNLLSWAQSIELVSLSPEIGTNSIDWAQLNRSHLKVESEFSSRNVVCFK